MLNNIAIDELVTYARRQHSPGMGKVKDIVHAEPACR